MADNDEPVTITVLSDVAPDGSTYIAALGAGRFQEGPDS